MRTRSLPLLLTLSFCLFLPREAWTQLEVDVVLDTVFYDAFGDIPAGSRTYRLYAVLEPNEIMIGLAADDVSNPSIPGWGFATSCGCYNWANPDIPGAQSPNAAFDINPGFLAAYPELEFDTWWTTHVDYQTPGVGAASAPGTFPVGYDICNDLITQGATYVTGSDPVHATVTNNRALIGQITTCETFEFTGCVAFQEDFLGGAVVTRCTANPIVVGDLCASVDDADISILGDIACLGDEGSIEVVPFDPDTSFTTTMQYSLFGLSGADTVLVQEQVGNPVFNGLGEGEYFVALVDTATTVAYSSNTCRDTTPNFQFIDPAELVFDAELTQDNLCGGEDIASICVNTSGGTGNLSLIATHVTTGLTLAPDAFCFDSLSCFGDGDYQVTVSDDAGCSEDTLIVISCPEPLSLDIGSTEVSCSGYSDATFSTSAVGGTGLVSLEIPELSVVFEFTGTGSVDQDSLPSGQYTFLLTDANGCELADTLDVEEPEGLTVTYGVTDVLCAGDCNGGILENATGGQLPYLVTLTDLTGSPVVSGALCPGEYIHVVEDGNQCQVSDTIEVAGADSITFQFSVSNVPCSGTSSGQICLDSLAGGTGPLTPQLIPLPTNSLDGDCFNVPAGTYSVLVTDSVGCASPLFSAVVEEPASIEILPTITPISCTGFGNGVLVVNAVGGSGDLELISPFEFPSLPDTLPNLGADTLNLIVADTLGCIDSLEVFIPEPEPVDVAVMELFLPECGGDCTGAIDVDLTGGTGSLTLFQQAVSDSTSVLPGDLVNLCADTYVLYVVDEQDCIDSVEVDIIEPAPLGFDITVQNVTCTGMNDGVAIIGTSGGAGETVWEFVGEDVDVLNLFEGSYSVSAADSSGCTADSTFDVLADIETDMVVEMFSTPVTCWQTADGTATAAVTGGQLPIQYEWSDAAGQTTATAIGLSEDVYSVTVTDDIGCTLGFLATVEPTEDCLFIADAITPNGDGINDRWVVGGLEFYPESQVEVFNRWGQLIFRAKPGTTWWDGTFNGAALPASDYYYVIQVETGAEPITGTVTLKY